MKSEFGLCSFTGVRENVWMYCWTPALARITGSQNAREEEEETTRSPLSFNKLQNVFECFQDRLSSSVWTRSTGPGTKDTEQRQA